MSKSIRLFLVLLLSVTAFSSKMLAEDTEDVKTCEAKWGHTPGQDCFCGGGSHEVSRTTRQVGATKLLEIHYSTGPTPTISHQGHDFGCWYLTTVNSPPGYRLLGVAFTSHSSTGGVCQLIDSINNNATDVSSFVSMPWHGMGGPYTQLGDEKKTSQDYQECIIYARTPEMVEFKWRLKGQEGARDNWQINEKGLQYTREQLKDKVKGISDFTLWYAPKS
jgi:hypothetical protein